MNKKPDESEDAAELGHLTRKSPKPVDDCVDHFPEVGFDGYKKEKKECLKLNEILRLPSPNGQVYRLSEKVVKQSKTSSFLLKVWEFTLLLEWFRFESTSLASNSVKHLYRFYFQSLLLLLLPLRLSIILLSDFQ